MKKILFVLLLLSSVVFAQQNDKKWAKVINYENEGKIKSANEIVGKIYKKAVSKKDEVQMIKCFFYQSKYLQVLDENAKTKILKNLKTDIDRVSIPSKAILNLVYAKCLNNYSNYDYAYAVVDSAVAVVDSAAALIDEAAATNDTSTFDSIAPSHPTDSIYDTISEKDIIAIYEKTLENEAVLKTTPLINYKAIFEFSALDKFKNQNLYDYIIKQNIAFYSDKLSEWGIEHTEFHPCKDQLFGNSNAFLHLNLDFVKDEDVKKVLTLYQKQEENNPSLENQFNRIKFCNVYLLKLDDAFLKAIDELQKSTKDETVIQIIQLEKASILQTQASKESHPDYNIEALKILDDIIKTNHQSNLSKQALSQKRNIISKSLNVQLQKYIYDNENTRAFILYKNVDQVKVSFYKIDFNTFKKIRLDYGKKDSIGNLLVKTKKSVASTNYKLQNKKDYFEYTTEVLLPQLKTGNYLVHFETDSDSKNEKAYTFETITVSNISVLATQQNNIYTFQALDRKTGKPLENVTVKKANLTQKTDSKGLASFVKTDNEYNFGSVQLSTANDTIFINRSYLPNNDVYQLTENSELEGKVEFYLDRAIYRPGQTVYYKGIAFQKKNSKTGIVANIKFKITITNPDDQSIKEFEAITNEFGSFSGEFILPKNGLTGSFTLSAERPELSKDSTQTENKLQSQFWENVKWRNSSTYFDVEEYKRPKFEVTFEPKTDRFQVHQNIKIKGTAKAFAGSSISDAKVSYTITRFTSYFRNYYGREQDEILATGETKTDASGKFNIEFIAEPAKNAVKEQLPVFNYRINVTITDINGETHSKETEIKVGFHDLIINAAIPSRIETKDKNEITLSSTNLNGEFLATKGEIKIYFISSFSNKFKNRIWDNPEIESISTEDFERLFPYERTEKPSKEITNEILLFTKNIDTQKDKKLALDFISNYESGNYKIVFTAKDSFNNPIESISNFQIRQSRDKFEAGKLFTATQINKDPKKDGFVEVKLSSIIPDLYIVTTGDYENKRFFENFYYLRNNETVVKIPLKSEFKKTVSLGFQTVFDNDTFSQEIFAVLKTNEPKLDWTVESIRNKIEPGTNEKWSFKLNAANTKNEAEVLASMYDSSLDQFSEKKWEKLNFYDYYENSPTFKSSLGFDTTYATIDNLNAPYEEINFTNDEPQLNWFGFNFNNSRFGEALAMTTADIKYKRVGSETIKGDADMKVAYDSAAAAAPYPGAPPPPPPPMVDQVRFVKPGLAKAEESTSDPEYYFQTNKIKFIPGKKITNGLTSLNITASTLYIIDGEISSEDKFKKINPEDLLDIEFLTGEKATALYGSKAANGVIIITTKKALEALSQVKARKNLSETAFFYPNLRTDANGKVSFNFTSPEALTAWKLRLLAHNKDAVSGYLEKSVITQKELMILPNFPRFFREKDTIVISAKISNVTDKAKTGIAILQFFDAVTMQPIDAKMLNVKNVRNFNVAAFGNTTTTWTISIPEGLQGVQYKILAKSGNFSDGEENILPVLTNNMLVTESIPVWVRENSTKEYTFENFKNNTSSTLKNHQFTFEYTSNPAWIAIQSLPYLMEYEHECAEQTFARFYANSLASEIISSNPKIATVFEDWRKNGKLNSKLEENEELKSLLLAETPWISDAQSEDEKKKNLALLFDLEKMKTSQEATFDKLKQKQKPSGGFSWFEGSDESEYITRHILAGLGHLSKLNKTKENEDKTAQISKTGIPFLDAKFLDAYKIRTKNLKAADKLVWINPNADLHYLYTRSFYLDQYPLSDTLKKATKLYLETAKKDWLQYSLYEKGLATLALNRFGEKETAQKILESLKETASNNEDWGMYWIANKSGWYWYQAPIETQALLIEAFAEVNHDTKSVDAMKVWLLKNKQTKNWPTTKSTTEAIYALLMQGTDWLSVKDNTIIKIGDEKIVTKKLSENEKEAETGYIKLNWKKEEVKKEMASINIQNKSKVPGFGGVYWQYFEDLDKIKNNSGAVLSVSKELYLKKNTVKGNELEKITTKNTLKTGDLVTVRLIITSKEDTEFVHLKDMRASCFEPVTVLSEYQYKDRLGYYMSTKDAATHFFFDTINKGTYIIEYDIRVNNSGEFSNGITTIESMYAPEFASHTKGIRVKVQ